MSDIVMHSLMSKYFHKEEEGDSNNDVSLLSFDEEGIEGIQNEDEYDLKFKLK